MNTLSSPTLWSALSVVIAALTFAVTTLVAAKRHRSGRRAAALGEVVTVASMMLTGMIRPKTVDSLRGHTIGLVIKVAKLHVAYPRASDKFIVSWMTNTAQAAAVAASKADRNHLLADLIAAAISLSPDSRSARRSFRAFVALHPASEQEDEDGDRPPKWLRSALGDPALSEIHPQP